MTPQQFIARRGRDEVPGLGQALRQHKRGRRFKLYRDAERERVRAAKESELRK